MKDLKFKKGKYKIFIDRHEVQLNRNVIEIEGYVNEEYQIGIHNSFAVAKACPELAPNSRYWVVDDLYSGYNYVMGLNTKKKCVKWINEQLDNQDFLDAVNRYQAKRDKGHDAINSYTE